MAQIILGLFALLILGTPSALAACPGVTGDTTAEMIKANQQRIVCLQQELADETRRRKQELDRMSLERSLQDLQLRQRLDAVPPPAQPFGAR